MNPETPLITPLAIRFVRFLPEFETNFHSISIQVHLDADLGNDLSRFDILALLLRLLKDSLTKGNKIIRRRPQKGPQALDAAQSFDTVIPGSSTPIKPLDYGTWPSSSQPLSEALRRDNLREATQNSMMGLTQEQRRMSTKEEDTFTEFRQILLSFGHRYDAGGRVFVLQDTQQELAIIVRVRRWAPFLMSMPPPSF